MYTGKHAQLRPLQPAFIMATSGEAVTYAELEARSNRLAHLFRKLGLKRLDHYAIFMENNNRYLEACGAGERSGLYYTCVNSYLTPGELAYIVNNSQSRVLITSNEKLDIAREALNECPQVELCIVADGEGESDRIVGLQQATAGLPKTPIADESIGTAMLYSSGTTGRPKGILRPLAEQPPGTLRSRTLSGTGREVGHHAYPAGTDDVLAHAEAAGTGAQALRFVVAGDCDPRRGTLPGAGEGRHDQMVGTNHP